MISVTETEVMVPLVALFVIVAVGSALLVWRRRKSSDSDGTVATFLPPIIVGKMPREQTYIVPRDWKPCPNGVYTPLSIPIEQSSSSTRSLLTGRMGSMIHVLPPKNDQAFV